MAWFRNYYTCDSCGEHWTDRWSCMCDDDCPHCGARHMSPDRSDDLTHVVQERNGEFVVLRSSEDAEHDPDYRELRSFPTEREAIKSMKIERRHDEA